MSSPTFACEFLIKKKSTLNIGILKYCSWDIFSSVPNPDHLCSPGLNVIVPSSVHSLEQTTGLFFLGAQSKSHITKSSVRRVSSLMKGILSPRESIL